MNRELREEMNRLSKEVFGTSSRWQKIMDNGVAIPHSRDREAMVPDGMGGVKKKIFTDKKDIIRHYNLDETKKLMEDILKERSEQLAKAGTYTGNSIMVEGTSEGVFSATVTAAE